MSELLEDLKLKYGKVATLTVPLDEDDSEKVATLYLKRPDRTTRNIVGRLAGTDSAKAIEVALKNLYVGGDKLELVLNNDYAFASLDEAIVEMLSVQKATLKKN
jgi:hypothetical protein